MSYFFLWDAKHGLLPDRFTCPLLWSGLLFSQVCNPDGLADALWGGRLLVTAHSLSFTGGYRILRHKEGLGYGDVKFLAALGAWHTGPSCHDWFSLLPHSLAEP
ncbi:A24 family peptidase [Escherichia coli]|nr:A24 family peptidase [Escherichia coli]